VAFCARLQGIWLLHGIDDEVSIAHQPGLAVQAPNVGVSCPETDFQLVGYFVGIVPLAEHSEDVAIAAAESDYRVPAVAQRFRGPGVCRIRATLRRRAAHQVRPDQTSKLLIIRHFTRFQAICT